MASKKKTVDKHFAARCIQRLGYVPDTSELVRKIQKNQLEFFMKESNRVTHWKWVDPVNNISCILPYDKERKQVITVLFEDSDMYLNNQKEIYQRVFKDEL